MHRGTAVMIATLAFAGGGCASFDRPTVRATRLRIAGIDVRGVNLAFEADVHNPYPVGIRGPQFRYALDIEENEFAKSQFPATADLPAQQVGTVVLPLRVEYVSLWKAIQSLGEAPEARYKLRATIAFTVLGEKCELPMSHEGRFPVWRMPRFRPGRPEFSGVSLSGAALNMPVDVHNPNVFAIDLKSAGYELRLGEVQVAGLTASTAGPIAGGADGRLTLSGRVTGRSILGRIMEGGDLGGAVVKPIGAVQTPYGVVQLGDN